MPDSRPEIPADPRRVHLLGICGTAMAALAGCLKEQGLRVTGSDAGVYPPMSDHLAALGISISEGYKPEHIPPDTDLVVVGNVVQASNPEAEAMRARGLPYLSMAEAVHRFAMVGRHAIAVVGTHGKTTTTALAAHTLTALGAAPGFLVGGIARNFDSNFALGAGDHFVIEGDEYDTAYFDKTPKFFKYHPRSLIFTSLEFDHADIYDDLDAIRVHFVALLEGLPPDGLLIACADDAEVRGLIPRALCPVVSYGRQEAAGDHCRVSEIRAEGETTHFVTQWRGRRDGWSIPMVGEYNVLNATAVLVLARSMGYGEEAVQQALAAFRGVKRRQEVRGEEDGITVIDDFAHHPTAVRLTIQAMTARYPGRPLWAVFEPRSFTARSDRFQAEFEGAFTGAARVVLAEPYHSAYSAGSQAPNTRALDTQALAEALKEQGLDAVAAPGTDAVLALLEAEAKPGDVVLIMSNGGFDNLHERLLTALRTR